MPEDNIESIMKQISALKAELEDVKKAAVRAQDYVSIMNVMSAHSLCYNMHLQEYEVEHFWSRENPKASYHNCMGYEGIYTYYTTTTEIGRQGQREIVKEKYGYDIPDNVSVGYRVQDQLTTPFIEIAGDGKTAQGIWMTHTIMHHLDENGKSVCNVSTGKLFGEFEKENGEWKLLRFGPLGGGFHLDCGASDDAMPPENGHPPKEGEEAPKRGTPFRMRSYTDEELQKMHFQPPASPAPMQNAFPGVPFVTYYTENRLPKPYETWDDTMSYADLSK